jgi:hypothetical protein
MATEQGINRQPEMDTSQYRVRLQTSTLGPPRQNDQFFGHYASTGVGRAGARSAGGAKPHNEFTASCLARC